MDIYDQPKEMPDDELSGRSLVAKWIENIRLYEAEYAAWEKKAQNVVKRYTDTRNAKNESRRRFNILWSNVQTLLPALYYSQPKPNVERRFKDKDPVGLEASEILERSTTYYVNESNFNSVARQVVLDRLLPGRGTMWIRYIPHFKAPVEITDEDQGEEDVQEVEYEEVKADYVHWKDFGHILSRTWEEVPAVWRKVYMDREELKSRKFKDWETIPLDYNPQENKDTKEQEGNKATVYEIWDKTKKQVIWVHKSVHIPLDVLGDPLGIKGFFPCPRPLYATISTDSLIPTPDYLEYQDQARELDELTARISSITKAIKVAGVYDASAQGLQNLLSEGLENKLIPVQSWAVHAEKGGLKGAIEFMPVQDIVQAAVSLYEARDKVKSDLNEITGIADIIRGNSDPGETASAQQIKGQYATLRLSDMQNAVSEHLKEAVQIMAEVIAGHFSVETLKMVSGAQLFTNAEKQQIQMQQQMAMQHFQQAQAMQQAHAQAQQITGHPAQGTPQPQAQQPPQLPSDMQEKLQAPSWEDVMALLQNKAALCFKIDIETDSTIKQDQDNDRKSAMEFIQTASQAIEAMAQIQNKAIIPLAGELLMFGVRKFKNARGLEAIFEETIKKLEDAPPAPAPQDPALQVAQLKAQSDMQIAQLKTASDEKMAQLKMQTDRLWANQGVQDDARDAQNSAIQDQQKFQANIALEKQKHADQMQLEMMKLGVQKETAMAKVKADSESKGININMTKDGLAPHFEAHDEKVKKQKSEDDDKNHKMKKAEMDHHEKLTNHIVGAVKELTAAVKKPKKLVRAPDGTALGVE